MELDEAITQLKNTTELYKDFLNDNEEIFNQRKSFTKSIKEMREIVMEAMKLENKTEIEVDGYKITLKGKIKQKHNIETLAEIFEDQSKVDRYVDMITQCEDNVSVRKAKKQKKD